MKINSPSTARAAWYDRNPLMISNDFATSSLAPAGNTSRWSYTVPSARKAALESSLANVIRETAATTAAYSAFTIQYTPSGGGGITIVRAGFNNNAVGTQGLDSKGSVGYLLAGDNIQGFTFDASTAGTLRGDVAVKVTEFDA